MNRNRLAYILILAAALNFSGCGGAAESAAGDNKAAAATPAANAATNPAPAAAAVNANTAAASTEAGAAAPTSAVDAAARQAAPTASPSRGANGATPAKAPTPQIGSGGNDFFLFTQARAAINNDPELKAANLVVEVKEGVVTLSGTVASAALKSKAEELARGAGSKSVRNQLRVAAAR
jgi:hypothetical protein